MILEIKFEPGEPPAVTFDDASSGYAEAAPLTSSAVGPLVEALEAVWPRPAAGADDPLLEDRPHPADRLRAEVAAWRGDSRSTAQAARDRAAAAKAVVDAFAGVDAPAGPAP